MGQNVHAASLVIFNSVCPWSSVTNTVMLFIYLFISSAITGLQLNNKDHPGTSNAVGRDELRTSLVRYLNNIPSSTALGTLPPFSGL
jgi:hypothetical protein